MSYDIEPRFFRLKKRDYIELQEPNMPELGTWNSLRCDLCNESAEDGPKGQWWWDEYESVTICPDCWKGYDERWNRSDK